LARAAASGFELKPHIVAVGVSTGGPNALVTLVSQLPRDLAVPLVLVQHMPPLFTRFLAERLSKLGGIPFREAEDGAELRPGMGWIAPGDFHVTVKAPVEAGQRATLELNQQPPENSCRPAVDPLFRSVAKVFGARALAIVLTGMGQDGLRGSEAIVEEGGRVVVQDEATSVVWGMPGFVATAGLADRILPLDQIGAEIVRRIEGIPGGASSRATPAPTHA
jgi:two-component system chemotaxis response regulator CheB